MSSMTAGHRKIIGTACVALLTVAPLGCAPPFESPALVTRPRVLAAIASSPTVAPGESFTVVPIVGGAMTEGSFRWTLCVRPELASTGLPLSSFGAFESERGCDTTGALSIAEAQSLRAPTFTVTAGLLEDERVLRAAFGEQLSSEALRSLATRAGVSIVATVQWTVDGEVVTAFKRVLVKRGEVNTNPPRPVLRVMGRELRAAAGSTDERCEFSDGAGAMRVAPGARVFIEPDPDASWVEEFTFVDASGNDVRESEQAFRNWFSTSGQWEFGRARAPDLNPTWVAPKTAGEATLWLIVRDGHGGTSACRWGVRVE
jgi:hypothetical protein